MEDWNPIGAPQSCLFADALIINPSYVNFVSTGACPDSRGPMEAWRRAHRARLQLPAPVALADHRRANPLVSGLLPRAVLPLAPAATHSPLVPLPQATFPVSAALVPSTDNHHSLCSFPPHHHHLGLPHDICRRSARPGCCPGAQELGDQGVRSLCPGRAHVYPLRG